MSIKRDLVALKNAAGFAASTVNEQVMPGCICKGNWRQIIGESEPVLDDLFTDLNGAVHRFVGVMHSRDDYYYVMVSMAGEYRLSSCVGNLETNGYKPVEA